MRVLELWRFPVKSLGGETLDSVDVGEAGVIGDRGWGIHHADTGTVLTARRAPELLFASARIDGEGADRVVITLPDGTETSNEDGDVDDVLSGWLQRQVTLIQPGSTGATYENPMDVENEADWIQWQGPSWSFHDSTKSMLSIVGSETLGDRDVRRFRTNVVVEGEGEDDLVGSSVTLGSSVLSITKPIDRCVMVTRAQPGLERDLDVLKSVIRERNNQLSIGALVLETGTVSVGDELRRKG
jgi:uncharacterized protein YcbX